MSSKQPDFARPQRALLRCVSARASRLALTTAVVISVVLLMAPRSAVGTIVLFSNPDGLSAEAEFILINPTTLQVRLKNTSTGVPADFGAGADQILTSISWDFNGTTAIAGGSVVTGPSSASLSFSVTAVGPNEDVGGEYGFGNGGATGLMTNYISGNTSGVTPFGGANWMVRRASMDRRRGWSRIPCQLV